MMVITLHEPFRALFYTPFYLAHALGTYAAEGLDVRLGTSPGPAAAPEQLREGAADVVWGGPMRILLHHDRDPHCGLVGFAEVVTRDPFFLVGRRPSPAFRICELATVSLAVVSEVPTPWMCLQDDLRRAGVDPERLGLETGRSMEENAQRLRAGAVDVIQVFQPHAESLLAEGAGHLWYAAASRGPCSYTTLYAQRRWLDANPDAALGMTRAIHRMQAWLHGNGPGEIAAAVAEFFPGVAPGLLTLAIARYLDLGVWGRDPRLPRAGFERLRGCLLSGGLIAREIPYEACVEPRFAREAIAGVPPSA